jgi:hypothetical protein
MWALDRDLLVLEPNLFRDVSWAGQQLLRTTGRISAGQLVLESGSFDPVRSIPGLVATIGRTSVEIVGEPGGSEATISFVRSTREGDVLPLSDTDVLDVVVSSFRPQIEIVHRHLLSMLGLATEDGLVPGALTEAAVINWRELVPMESLGALHLIYSAAAAPSGSTSWMDQRVESFRRRFAEERWRTAAQIDTDADGVADATRRFNITRLQRI